MSDKELEKNEKSQEPKKKGLAAIWQFIKFGMVGAMNTVVSYVTYTIVYYTFRNILGETIAMHCGNVLGFVISVFNAFIWQSKFVFKESEDGEHRVWWKVLIKTYISYAFTGLFLSTVLLALWVDILKIGDVFGPYLQPVVSLISKLGVVITPKDLAVSIAPFLNMVVTIPINFLVNKFWAYRQKKKED